MFHDGKSKHNLEMKGILLPATAQLKKNQRTCALSPRQMLLLPGRSLCRLSASCPNPVHPEPENGTLCHRDGSVSHTLRQNSVEEQHCIYLGKGKPLSERGGWLFSGSRVGWGEGKKEGKDRGDKSGQRREKCSLRRGLSQ